MMLHLQSLKYFSIGMPLKSVDKKSTLDSFIFSKKKFTLKSKKKIQPQIMKKQWWTIKMGESNQKPVDTILRIDCKINFPTNSLKSKLSHMLAGQHFPSIFKGWK